MDEATQKVKVEYTISLEQEVPKEWDKAMIEFYFNDSSWCADNLIDELTRYSEEHGCICNITKAKLV